MSPPNTVGQTAAVPPSSQGGNLGDGHSEDTQGWQAHSGGGGALRPPRTMPGIVHRARPCSDPAEDSILPLGRWLLKTSVSGPGFAGSRCARHNAPFLQASSVAAAVAATLLICPVAARVPATRSPPSTTAGVHFTYSFRSPPPQRQLPSSVFQDKQK